MKATVYNMQGEAVEEIELLESIFDIEPHKPIMHQALVRQQANARQGTHATQSRSEVNRTGAKVWRQKGTGRARHGSRRAPIFVGGGVAHGPKPRKYTKAMPRKMRRLAIRSALAAKAQAGQLILVDELSFEKPSTKQAAAAMKALGVTSSAVVLTDAGESDDNMKRSFRNLDGVLPLHWQYVNVRDLLGHDRLIIPVAALRRIEELWG